jgi:hypothetical protein
VNRKNAIDVSLDMNTTSIERYEREGGTTARQRR